MRVRAVNEARNPVAGVEIWYDRDSAAGGIGGVTGEDGQAEVILEKDKPANSFFFISGKLQCSMPGPQVRWPLLVIVKPGKIIATPDER